jgi:hypothetical protein
MLDNEKKTAMQIPNMFMEGAEIASSESNKDFNVKDIPSKNILGYKCKGIKVTHNKGTVLMYSTAETPISFDFSLMTTDPRLNFGGNFPPGVDKYGKKLMMEMHMIGAGENEGHVINVYCKELKKQNLTIDLSQFHQY